MPLSAGEWVGLVAAVLAPVFFAVGGWRFRRLGRLRTAGAAFAGAAVAVCFLVLALVAIAATG